MATCFASGTVLTNRLPTLAPRVDRCTERLEIDYTYGLFSPKSEFWKSRRPGRQRRALNGEPQAHLCKRECRDLLAVVRSVIPIRGR